jgi:hypothetical protein
VRDPIRQELEGEIVASADTIPDQIVQDKHLLMQVALSLFLGYRAS